ncbi:hypothetical protein BGW38_001091 [Lunasporangiospora selenospora]|uniref:Uncharacterized protein n=1 Tax=Lunasporangiospora selenospora TaxID=979761 RepID=A0A9P6KEI4_9FUNG|nr:hypothetical protein BGW38_001091 [Lunasporangiospora selenospora]
MEDQSRQEQQRRTLALTDDTVSYAIYIAPSRSGNRVSLESVRHARKLIQSIISSILQGIQDNDGELLLIEAADHIPSWLDPESSENRVFIFNGDLHIVPIAVTAEEKISYPGLVGTKSVPPKLQDALDLIRSSSIQMGVENKPSTHRTFTTTASPQIQQAAFAPLQQNRDTNSEKEDSYVSQKKKEQKHYARCQVPVAVAQILQTRPELVTRACEAFYTREVFGMAACSRMATFFPTLPQLKKSEVAPSMSTPEPFTLPSRTPPTMEEVTPSLLGKNQTPFVTTAVCFTRTCYAQLMGQQFHPPKIWDGIVPTQDANNSQKTREAELGMKLTCGFEILCSPDFHGDFGYRSGQKISIQEFPFDTDKGWSVFKNSLTNRKYFGDERSGSQEYRKLEKVAQKQYLDKLSKHSHDDSDAESDPATSKSTTLGFASYCGHGYHPVDEIHRILDTNSKPDSELSTDIKNKKLTKFLVDNRPDDVDSWMDVDLEDLERMMRARGLGGLSAANTDNGHTKESKDGLDVQQMLDRFGEFVQEGKGGIEGAEFSDDPLTDDDSSTDDEDEEGDPTSTGAVKPQDSHTQDAQDLDESESEGEEEDPFASDYEERLEKKRATKKKGRAGASDEVDSYAFVFDNGQNFNPLPSDKVRSAAFALDREKMKEVLVKTFGNGPLTNSASEASRTGEPVMSMKGAQRGLGRNDAGGNNDEAGAVDQDLRAYMAELDAELSQTKIGESFEKMTGRASTSPSSRKDVNHPESANTATNSIPKAKGKGKAVVKDKPLEDLVKEFSDKLRRGQGRYGPLPLSDQNIGYDPASMFGQGNEDEEDSEEDTLAGPRLTIVDSDDDEAKKEALESDQAGGEELEEVVDVDLTLAKNLLESFRSQAGLPGPGGNLLSRLGIIIPRDEGDEE